MLMTADVYRTLGEMPRRNWLQFGGLICMQLLDFRLSYTAQVRKSFLRM